MKIKKESKQKEKRALREIILVVFHHGASKVKFCDLIRNFSTNVKTTLSIICLKEITLHR